MSFATVSSELIERHMMATNRSDYDFDLCLDIALWVERQIFCPVTSKVLNGKEAIRLTVEFHGGAPGLDGAKHWVCIEPNCYESVDFTHWAEDVQSKTGVDSLSFERYDPKAYWETLTKDGVQ